MTSSAAAAAELARALSPSPSEKHCQALREFADFCDIPITVVNKLTKSDFSDFYRLMKLWMPIFFVTIKRIDSLIEALNQISEKSDKQMLLYVELSTLRNTFTYFESCRTHEFMLQFVRGLSAFFLVETAMIEYALDEARKAGANERRLEAIRDKKRVFFGDKTMWHTFRMKEPWDDGSKITLNVSALLYQINKMAKWAGVQEGKNPEVDDLLFQARLDNLRECPLKLTAIDRLVQAFADEASRNFLAKLAPAGSKNCRGA
jgi:hypothetical protein